MTNPIPHYTPDSPEWAFRAVAMINERDLNMECACFSTDNDDFVTTLASNHRRSYVGTIDIEEEK